MTTIADVAHAAGVSISTVSYVMSGKRTISQDTRDRVERAIEELAYRPHASARSLASRTTHVIGLQAPLRSGVDVHVIMQIVAGVVREARALHYDVLLLTSDDASGLERAARGSMVDALLVMDIESHDPRLAALATLPVPSVLIGLPAGAGDLVCVDFDFEAAGALAAARLAARGHHTVALLGAPSQVMDRHTSYADRLARGFLTGSADSGIQPSVHPCPSGVEATRLLDELLASDPAITGILVHNEAALPHVAAHLAARADGVVREIVALAPRDLALPVPGIAEIIDLPAEEIGTIGARVLLGALAGAATERVHLIAPHVASGHA